MLALREEVFSFEQQCSVPDFDGLDKFAVFVLGLDKDKVVAAARILPPGVYAPNAVSFGRVVVKKPYRSKGAGKKIIEIINAYCEKNHPKFPIKFSAQIYLQQSYEKFGAMIKSCVWTKK